MIAVGSRRLDALRSGLIVGAIGLAVALLFCIAGISETAARNEIGGPAPPAATIRLLQSDQEGIGFSLETPVVQVPARGELVVTGLDMRLSEPGTPRLPYYATYVVLPPESQPRLSVDLPRPSRDVDVHLPPATAEHVQAPTVLEDLELLHSTSALLDQPELMPMNDFVTEIGAAADRPIIAPEGVYPRSIVEVSEPMMYRDVRLVRVAVYPYRYDSGQRRLNIAPEIDVHIDFERAGPSHAQRLAPSHQEKHLETVAHLVLNPEQIQEFRSLPDEMTGSGTLLPLGKQLFKIGVVEDGIYQLTYQDLKDAGMDVDSVDATTFEMMYRGEAVAIDFVGDDDEAFEIGEAIRFYGRAFDGSRLERQFISENVFWLWAGGQKTEVEKKMSLTGEPVTTYLSSVTREPEIIYFPGNTAYWPENESDAWYWDWLRIRNTPISHTYTVTLPYPALTGPLPRFTAEFSSRDSHLDDQQHNLSVSMNDYPIEAEHTWWGERNFNVSAAVPLSNVVAGPNRFKVTAYTLGTAGHVFPNRITVDYQRELVASEDQLIFTDEPGGDREYFVRGFSQPTLDNILAWDITNPNAPAVIMTPTVLSGTQGYTYTFGLQHQGQAKFIVTTQGNVLAPASLSTYVAPDLNPQEGADWVAIAYHDFIAETERLASHRSMASFGGLSTHIVDVADIVNQYGYGLPIPAAIQNYLAYALTAWPVKPTYVVLVGDTTLDPRHIKDDWQDLQHVPTDLVFVDRYIGQIPSDLTFALVSGSDLLPDLAVGRLAVQSVDEMELVVDKIIRYDKNQLLSFGWMQNMLYLGDKSNDAAGEHFCDQNTSLANLLPAGLNADSLCLDDYKIGTTYDATALRHDLTRTLEITGVTLLTYRGHGDIGYWAGDPTIFALADAAKLKNRKPFVVVTGDCEDGHYAYPPWEGLGERLVNSWAPSEDIYGAAAHWGSSGLGVPSDHTRIMQGLYDGLFAAGITALGNAADHAKLVYYEDPRSDPAFMYSFNLQGDPAMHLMRPNVTLQGAWQQETIRAGEPATMTLDLHNYGLYPSRVTLVGEPIEGFSITDITSSVRFSATTVGGGTTIALQFGEEARDSGIPRNGQVSVKVTYAVAPDALPGPRLAQYTAIGSGYDTWPGDETTAQKIALIKESLWLAIIQR